MPFTTVAFVLLLAQVPPLTASVSVTLSPTHKLAVNGLIAAGALLTVTGLVTKQPDELVNVMFAVPMPEPVTMPVPLPTLAILPLLLLHVPLPSDNVVLEPRQIVTGVTGMIAEGDALTVTLAVVMQLPIAYVITAVPALAPVTVPLTTVALELPLVQVPPDTPSVSTVLLPTQSTAVKGLIEDGELFTVTVAVAEQVPLEYVIEATPTPVPNTIPVVPAVTTDTEEDVLLHVPPDVTSLKVSVEPRHMAEDTGVMEDSAVLTVTVFVTEQIPEV